MVGMIASVIARQLVTMLGGGVAGSAEGELVSQLSGALVAIFGVAWSIYEKRGQGAWTREHTFGLVRHVLAGLGGVAAGQGLITDDAATAGAGGAATAVAILWSLAEKRFAARAAVPAKVGGTD